MRPRSVAPGNAAPWSVAPGCGLNQLQLYGMHVAGPAAGRAGARPRPSTCTRTDRPPCRRRVTSSTGPAVTTWPPSTIAMWVQRSASSARMCEEMTTALPIRPARGRPRAAPGGLADPGRGRLVQQQHGRVVDQRSGQPQPLLHPPGEPLDVAVPLVAQVHQVEQIGGHGRPPLGRDAVAGGVEVEVLADLQLRVDAEEVRACSRACAARRPGRADRGAADPGLAAVRAPGASRASGSRSSCRAVRADQAVDRAGLDAEREVETATVLPNRL